MLERVLGAGHSHRYADVLGDQRQHTRRPLQKFGSIRSARQRFANDVLVPGGQMRLAADLFDVISIRLSRRYAARGRVGLLQESGIRQIRHDIADGGWAESLPIGTRKHARTDRLAGGDKRFNNRCQNFPFSVPYRPRRRHNSLLVSS